MAGSSELEPRPWRFGTVPYLNADPLTAALARHDSADLVGEAAVLRSAVPAVLLSELLAGRHDAALVSVGGILPQEELRIVPGWGVISHGPVRSIMLYCRRPIEEVCTVALDSGSRSGRALARLLLAQYWRLEPDYVTCPPDLDAMLGQADAALLIGNPALQASARVAADPSLPVAESYDLGEIWRALTGLPFVYAAWAVRADSPMMGNLERLESILSKAAAWGMEHREELAREGASSLNLPLQVTRGYLQESIRYRIDEAAIAGIHRFCKLGVESGVLPSGAEVRMLSGASVRGG